MTEVVWLTSGYPWPGDPVGGVFFQAQAQALTRAGLSLKVVAPVPAAPWPLPLLNRRWRAHAAVPRAHQDGPLAIVRPRFLNAPGQPGWAKPDRFIADAAWRAHDQWAEARLIHAHYSIIGLAARRLSARAGIPYTLTFHGGDLNVWPQQHPGRVQELGATIREAAAVFTVSDALADRVRSLSGIEAVHLPIGVDHRWIASVAPSRSLARRALGVPEDRFLVLFVGRLTAPKGVPELVEAMLGLGDPFTAVLVGPGPLEGLGADDPRAGGRLRYLGARGHDDVIRSMAAADVLVLPSHSEGLPTVLVEAGSIGLPVIASAVGGIPSLLAAGRGTILPSPSPAAIREAIIAAREDAAAARAAAQRLRDHVHREYDIDRNAGRLIDHYRRIDPSIGRGTGAMSARPEPDASPGQAR